MRIATWNVNSIKQRMDNLLAWLRDRQPDIVCLQEIKCVDEAFPRYEFETLGYNVAVHGQKAFNGVAILSKTRFDEVTPWLPGDDDDTHARFLEVVVPAGGGIVTIRDCFAPLPWYRVERPAALSETQRGPPGGLTTPHGLRNWGSVFAARPGRSETRFTCL